MSVPSTAASCRLVRVPGGPMAEFAAFSFPLGGAFVVGWPAAPGAVRHDEHGRPLLLHFAPARWLAPTPHADVDALIEAAVQAAVGTRVEVAGKWQPFELVGAGAARLLASTIDVDGVLEGRECAAVTLFDCPAILARVSGGFAIWVRASFGADFASAAARLGAAS